MLHPLLHHISPLFPSIFRGIRVAELPNIVQIRIAEGNKAEAGMEEVGKLQEVVTLRWALSPVGWHVRNGLLWPDFFRRHRPCGEG